MASAIASGSVSAHFVSKDKVQRIPACASRTGMTRHMRIERGRNPKRLVAAGFTLIELLVVLAIIATLLTLAVPRYFGSVEKSKEAVLKQNLATLRDSLDKYYGDTGRYPDSLDDLVTKKY